MYFFVVCVALLSIEGSTQTTDEHWTDLAHSSDLESRKNVCKGDIDCLKRNCAPQVLARLPNMQQECEGVCDNDGMFSCGTESGCIMEEWTCDGDRDCPDGLDEETTMCKAQCKTKPGHVLCNDGRCITDDTFCFGDACEANVMPDYCRNKCEFAGRQIMCNNTNTGLGVKCIYDSYLCDGNADCQDGGDESVEVCRPICLARGDVMCGGKCYDRNELCLGAKTCTETDVVKEACAEHCPEMGRPFVCKMRGHQHNCIELGYVCDNDRDCPGGEDEENCPLTCQSAGGVMCGGTCKPLKDICHHPTSCGNGHVLKEACEAECASAGKTFMCEPSMGGTVCIFRQNVCDGENDCPSGEDERNCG